MVGEGEIGVVLEGDKRNPCISLGSREIGLVGGSYGYN